MRVLLLGGTTEASLMARILAEAGVNAIFSYAGRTAAPRQQPLPVRVGGFGGPEGLAAYLRDTGITRVIDATHPFAAQMSKHAITACAKVDVPLLAFERAPWIPKQEDNWLMVPDVVSAVAALPVMPAKIFLAIGKQLISVFATRPQHEYLLRLVDSPEAPLPLANANVVIARGPFTEEGDTALMQHHCITHVVAKNAGGMGARAKLDAARALGLPVILIDRPVMPPRVIARTPEDVMKWLGHPACLGV